MKQGLSAPVQTVTALTINSFPDKTKLKYIPMQDVISKVKSKKWGWEGGDKGKRKIAR